MGRLPYSFAGVMMEFTVQTSTTLQTESVHELLQSANFSADYEKSLAQYGTVLTPSATGHVVSAMVNRKTLNSVSALEVTLSGARVSSVTKDMENGDWLIVMNYAVSSNTFVSTYFSRSDKIAVGQRPNQFEQSSHACSGSFSPCCILKYVDDYHTGLEFRNYMKQKLSIPCAGGFGNMTTLSLFDMAKKDEYTTSALDQVEGASINKTGDSTLEIRLSRNALRNHIGRVTKFDNTEVVNFFVGVTFLTMLRTNAIASTNAQINIELNTNEMIEFATVTSQAVSPIRYTQISLEQIKYLENTPSSKYAFPQIARLVVVLDPAYREDSTASLIPADSIQWTIDTEMPDIGDERFWTTACSDEGYPESMRRLYESTLNQSCATIQTAKKGICSKAVSTDISGIGEIFIPLGDDTVTDEVLESKDMTLFVQFNIRTEARNGLKHRAVSTMFIQAALLPASLIERCNDITRHDKLDDVTDMHIAVGIADEAGFENSVQVLDNMISNPSGTQVGNVGDSLGSVFKECVSYADGLISLYITGDHLFFAEEKYELFIEDLWSVHTRGEKTTQIAEIFKARQAFTTSVSLDETSVEVSAHSSLQSTCNRDATCAYRHDMRRRSVLNDYAVYEHGTKERSFDMERATQWLQSNVLGSSPFAKKLSHNFTSHIRSRKQVNDRYNKVYFINPTHRWMQEPYTNPYDLLLITDTVFLFGIIMFEDEIGVRRRRLLTIGPDGVSISVLDDLRTTKAAMKLKNLRAYLIEKTNRIESGKSLKGLTIASLYDTVDMIKSDMVGPDVFTTNYSMSHTDGGGVAQEGSTSDNTNTSGDVFGGRRLLGETHGQVAIETHNTKLKAMHRLRLKKHGTNSKTMRQVFSTKHKAKLVNQRRPPTKHTGHARGLLMDLDGTENPSEASEHALFLIMGDLYMDVDKETPAIETVQIANGREHDTFENEFDSDTHNEFDSSTDNENEFETATDSEREFETFTNSENEFDGPTDIENEFDTFAATENEFDDFADNENEFDTLAATENEFDDFADNENEFDTFAATENEFDDFADNENEFDGFAGIGNSFDVDDESLLGPDKDTHFQKGEGDVITRRRTLLQNDETPAATVDGNPQASQIKNSVANVTADLQIAASFGGIGKVWQIIVLSFSANVVFPHPNGISVGDLNSLNQVLMGRLKGMNEWIFPDSEKIVLIKSPQFRQNSNVRRLLASQGDRLIGMEVMVIWPNGTLLSKMAVSAARIECVGRYGSEAQDHIDDTTGLCILKYESLDAGGERIDSVSVRNAFAYEIKQSTCGMDKLESKECMIPVTHNNVRLTATTATTVNEDTTPPPADDEPFSIPMIIGLIAGGISLLGSAGGATWYFTSHHKTNNHNTHNGDVSNHNHYHHRDSESHSSEQRESFFQRQPLVPVLKSSFSVEGVLGFVEQKHVQGGNTRRPGGQTEFKVDSFLGYPTTRLHPE